VTPRLRTGYRWLAWGCALVVLLAVLAPAAAGGPAILPPAGPAFGPPVAFTVLRAAGRMSSPGLLGPVALPARAPPLA